MKAHNPEVRIMYRVAKIQASLRKKRSAGKRTQHRRSITSDQFKDARIFSGLCRAEAADLLGVSLRTIGHWETAKARPSYAALRLLRILRNGELIDPAWSGYHLRRGALITPEGHTVLPGDMSWHSLLVRRSNALTDLLRQRDAAATAEGGHAQRWLRSATSVDLRRDFVQIREAVVPKDVFPLLPSSNRGVSETERLQSVDVLHTLGYLRSSLDEREDQEHGNCTKRPHYRPVEGRGRRLRFRGRYQSQRLGSRGGARVFGPQGQPLRMRVSGYARIRRTGSGGVASACAGHRAAGGYTWATGVYAPLPRPAIGRWPASEGVPNFAGLTGGEA